MLEPKKYFELSFKSSSSKILSFYCNFIKNNLNKLKIPYTFISLPSQNIIYTLLRSPHVNKKSKEQFEIRFYKKLLKIQLSLNFKQLNLLIINKPKTIFLTIKTQENLKIT